ncbi:hypothetical protein ACI2L4_10060 [Streptomyces sparsogenes]|uniref:hypothetical protein n=1 Tax=Streptomyces sparsogenes TaxID=67365 RepID=UPI00384FF99B
MTSGGFDDIFAELTNINAEQVLLSERVNLLEEQVQGSPSPGSGDANGDQEHPVGAPLLWNDVDAEEWPKLWPKFVNWVVWLADRYEMTTDQLPRQCWWKHGAVVEELTALWTSHQSAYASGEDGGSAPYLWQDALARAIERIGRFWLGSCRNGQHKERHREAAWSGDEDYLNLLLSARTAGYGASPGAQGGGATSGTPDRAPSEEHPEVDEGGS